MFNFQNWLSPSYETVTDEIQRAERFLWEGRRELQGLVGVRAWLHKRVLDELEREVEALKRERDTRVW